MLHAPCPSRCDSTARHTAFLLQQRGHTPARSAKQHTASPCIAASQSLISLLKTRKHHENAHHRNRTASRAQPSLCTRHRQSKSLPKWRSPNRRVKRRRHDMTPTSIARTPSEKSSRVLLNTCMRLSAGCIGTYAKLLRQREALHMLSTAANNDSISKTVWCTEWCESCRRLATAAAPFVASPHFAKPGQPGPCTLRTCLQKLRCGYPLMAGPPTRNPRRLRGSYLFCCGLLS